MKKKINLKDKKVQTYLLLVVAIGVGILMFFNPIIIFPFGLIAYLFLRYWQSGL